ncbi:MAG: acyltransferase domain-containing protein, partial [Pseudonocardiaceae bacterium]
QPLKGPLPLALSAKSPEALQESAERLKAHLEEDPEQDLADVAYSLLATRSTFEHRAVAVGEGKEQLLEALGAIATGAPSRAMTAARAKSGRLAYLLTGQGSQRAGMGKELAKAYPAYAQALEEALAEIDPRLERPLGELLFAKPGSPEAELLGNTAYAQPALFATHLALHRLFESWGLEPDLLAGHSVGEISAARISGVLNLPDAAKLICARSTLMGELPSGGAMLAVGATEQEAAEAIEGFEAELSLAAVNSPSSVVLSGAEEAIAAQEARWQERGKKTKRLAVSHAFHSPLIEPMQAAFAEVAKTLSYSEPKIPILSNLTGEILAPEQAEDPAYWVSHARAPVRFAEGIATLCAQGASACVELGPDPALCAMAAECLAGQEQPPALIATLREGRPEAQSMTLALAAAHAAGAKVRWASYFEGTGAKRAKLPTYPFQRKRYWL